MRAIWSGSISFGLVNIPVRLYSAAEERGGVELHLLHKADGAPIKYARICTRDGAEVPYEDVEKGYEYEPGRFVPLDDADFAAADPRRTSTVEVMEFAEAAEIDVRYLERPFYLEPEEGAAGAYALLREALQSTGLVAVARMVLREREHLALIRPLDAALVLVQLRWPSDVLPPAGLKLPAQQPAPAELKLAQELIRQRRRAFAPKDFHDTYTEKLKTRIAAKLRHAPTEPAAKAAAPAAATVNLIEALRASLEKGAGS